MKKNLLELYNDILKQEKEYMQKALSDNISVKNIHLVVCIDEMRKENKSVCVNSICQEFLTNKSSISRSVNKLINKGYIFKQLSANSTQNQEIFLTYNGEFLIEEYQKFQEKTIETLVSSLSKQDLTTLLNALNDIRQYFV